MKAPQVSSVRGKLEACSHWKSKKQKITHIQMHTPEKVVHLSYQTAEALPILSK
jgi:hypothetical protein